MKNEPESIGFKADDAEGKKPVKEERELKAEVQEEDAPNQEAEALELSKAPKPIWYLI